MARKKTSEATPKAIPVTAYPALNEKERTEAIYRIREVSNRITEGYFAIIDDFACLRASYGKGKVMFSGTTYKNFQELSAEIFGFSRSTYFNLCQIIDRYFDASLNKIPDDTKNRGMNSLLREIREENSAAKALTSAKNAEEYNSINDAQSIDGIANQDSVTDTNISASVLMTREEVLNHIMGLNSAVLSIEEIEKEVEYFKKCKRNGINCTFGMSVNIEE